MNAIKLTEQAALSTAPYLKAVSPEVARRLELGHITLWLHMQDEAHHAAALRTALEATSMIIAHYERTA